MKLINEIYQKIKKKYLVSKVMFISLNITSIVLTTLLILLNLFMISKNPFKSQNTNIMVIFVIIAVLTGVSIFISSLLSFFIYKKQLKVAEHKLALIEMEVANHNKQVAPYDQEVNHELLLLERIKDIQNNVDDLN